MLLPPGAPGNGDTERPTMARSARIDTFPLPAFIRHPAGLICVNS